MAKKRTKRPSPESRAVTAERAARLYHLLKLVGARPQTRAVLIRRLRLDIRGFYRDLELLRVSGIELPLTNRRYSLEEDATAAIARLPFPDPHLTLGEAIRLSKGRTLAHRKLKGQVDQIIKASGWR